MQDYCKRTEKSMKMFHYICNVTYLSINILAPVGRGVYPLSGGVPKSGAFYPHF